MSRIEHPISSEEAEAVLGAMVDSQAAGGSCDVAWTHEITAVVKHCGVVVSNAGPILQVNPSWLRELMTRNELCVLADEIRTWNLINTAAEVLTGRPRKCPAA